jgi:cbb3-type cytochrome oxidase maturation protein
MEILILLIPLSVVLVFLIGAAFWWSVRSGQFDDLEGPAHRIITDDDSPVRPASTHDRGFVGSIRTPGVRDRKIRISKVRERNA